MNFRKFFRVFMSALNGDSVCVYCATERDANSAFEDCVQLLQKMGGPVDWKAHQSCDNQHVDFDGGGSVRLVSSSHLSDGAIWDYECFDDTVYDEFLRRVLNGSHQQGL